LSSTFLQKTKKLSNDHIDLLLAQECDHQTVGKTHDIGAAVAIATVHTVVVGAGSFGHGDLAVLNSDDIVAVSGLYGELLILMQRNGFDHLAVAGDLCGSGGLTGHQKIETQAAAQ
jgi:hypothetical protein